MLPKNSKIMYLTFGVSACSRDRSQAGDPANDKKILVQTVISVNGNNVLKKGGQILAYFLREELS
jgi:hypothetical protein